MNNRSIVSIALPFFALFLTIAVAGCHELEQAASVVPNVVQCPAPDFNAADELIARFAHDPDLVRVELTEAATSSVAGALDVTCKLLAAQARLLETGQRFTNAYHEVVEGLAALGISQ
jgi:hypothetical protein